MTHNGPGQFGVLLQRHRNAAGLSQDELADRAGLSQRGISDLERGRRRAPHPATVRRLAEALALTEADRGELLRAARTSRVDDTSSAVRSTRGEIRHNLPLQVTSFVGRVQESADVRRELRRTRLLTLTGPGGVGKTRLALHVAEQELANRKDGVWFVELAPVHELGLVPQLVANVFNLQKNQEEPLITSLARRLHPLELLLVLDNCEHVLGACVDVVHRLLRACPQLIVLTTSRAVLGVAGETIWRVPPLRIAPPEAAAALEQVEDSEAAALFVERARAVQPDFVVSRRNAASVLDVCRRLEGIPLAIELAANRVGVFGLDQLRARMASHFGVLSSSDPTIERRQQTLDNTVQWSYDLLTPPERRLFDCLSVFAGGWSVEAMEAVAGAEIGEDDSSLELLARLVDKSLVLADTQGDRSPRYRLLEPLRQFGQSRLRERGELYEAQSRHAAFFIGLLEQVWDAFLKEGSADVWLGRDLDNLRAAQRWLIAQRDVDGAQRLAGMSGLVWSAVGFPVEGCRWLEEVLALEATTGPAEDRRSVEAEDSVMGARLVSSLSQIDAHRLSVRAMVLSSISRLAVHQGDLRVAEQAGTDSLELYRELGDTAMAALSLQQLGRSAQLRAEFDKARRLLEETLSAYRKSRNSRNVPAQFFDSAPLSYLAQVAREQGNSAEALERAEEAMGIARTIQFPSLVCLAATILGELHHDRGRLEVARSVWDEGLSRVTEVTQRHHYIVPLIIDLSRLATERGDREAAASLLVEALTSADERSRWQLAHALEAAVEMLAADNHLTEAFQLAGTAAALRDKLETPLWPTERGRLEVALARARERMGTVDADIAWRSGRITPVDQALGLAFDLIHRHVLTEAAWTAGTTWCESNSSVSGSDSRAR